MKSWDMLKDLYVRFINDDLLSTGAVVTFFLLLSFSPFFVFLITLITYIPMINIQDIIEILTAFMPAEAHDILQEIVSQIIVNRSGTLLSFGMLFTLWLSSSAVSSLIRGINRAYDQEETRPLWKILAVTLYFTIVLAAAIILSLTLIVFGKILGTHILYFFGFPELSLEIWNYVRYSVALITSIFVLISLYHDTPNRRLSFRETMPGAIAASIGWVIISIAFSYYANNLGNYLKEYGSLSGIIALLTWIYLSSIIILMGAEINASLTFSKLGSEKQKLKRF